MKGSFKDYLDSAIFTLLGLHSLHCLSHAVLPTLLHLPFLTSQIFSFRLSVLWWREMESFQGRVSHSLPPNLTRVHDTNTETDISSPASLHDIYHCAS